MMPDWMIDAIEQQEQEQERPRLEIPIPPEDWRPFPEPKEEAPTRGVVTFDVWGD